MRRKRWYTIVWMLLVAMAFATAQVGAQPPAAGSGAQKPKLDFGYITPESVAIVSLYPQSVLTSPEMELLPIEVVSALGIKELGIDPLQIEHALLIAEPSPDGSASAGPPQTGFVLHFSSPVGQGKLLGPLWEQTTAADLNGKPYRRGNGSKSPSIFQADPQTLIVADDGLLKKMVANHAKPQEGKMAKMLARVSDAPDLLAVVLVEPLRPAIAATAKAVPLPPPLSGLTNVPNLRSLDL